MEEGPISIRDPGSREEGRKRLLNIQKEFAAVTSLTPLTHCLSWSMFLGRPLSVFTRPMTSLNPHRHLVVAHEGVAGVNAGLGVCALGAFAEVLLLVLAEERVREVRAVDVGVNKGRGARHVRLGDDGLLQVAVVERRHLEVRLIHVRPD